MKGMRKTKIETFYENPNLLIPHIFFLFGCTNDVRKEPAKQVTTDTPIKATSAFEIVYTDTLFYSVYELSSKTTAIVVNINEAIKPTKLDSIFNRIAKRDSFYLYEKPKNYQYVDTLGEYKLLANKKLEQEVKKHFENELYVYGTRGVAKVKIKNVLIGLDECRTNIFAFPINEIDTTLIGHPLLSSKQRIDLKYKDGDKIIEAKIDRFQKSQEWDYTDSIKTKVFASLGNLYFTYNDDFKWGKNPSLRNCFFPTRTIYRFEKNKPLKRFWADGLDLFGIPCD